MRELLTLTTSAPIAGFTLAAVQRAALVCAIVVSLAVLPAALAALIGYDTYVVTGGSMAPSVRDGSLVIAQRVDPAAVRPGEIITYRHPDRPAVPVTHRVMQVFEDSDGRFFQTKGDANAAPDSELVHADRPISRMVLTVPYAGQVLGALRTLPGQVVLIGLPALILATRLLQQRRLSMSAMPSAVPAPRSRRAVEQQVQEVTMVSHTSVSQSSMAAPRAGGEGSDRGSWLKRLFGGLARPASVGMPRMSMSMSAARSGAATAGRAEETERMRRLATFIDAHAALTQDLGGSVEEGMEPLRELIESHARNAARLEANLDRQLQPVREYADQLEANLDQLLARLQAEGSAASHTLRQQFEVDRQRAREVRAAIERTKAPLRAALAREAAAIDALLAGFDADVSQLERTLTDQRRDLMRVASGLRSDQVGEALGFLRDRSAELAGIADAGIAEFDEVDAALRVSLERARREQRGSGPLTRVLETLERNAGASPRIEAA